MRCVLVLGALALAGTTTLGCAPSSSGSPAPLGASLTVGAFTVSTSVVPRGPGLSVALIEMITAPVGRVERRTTLGVAAVEVTMVSTLSWDTSGGELASRLQAGGPLVGHPGIAAILASREQLAQADDRLLDPDDLALEQDGVVAGVIGLIGEIQLADDGAGRLVGERIVGGTVERVTVEIEQGHLVFVGTEFGGAGAGGRDEWRFYGG